LTDARRKVIQIYRGDELRCNAFYFLRNKPRRLSCQKIAGVVAFVFLGGPEVLENQAFYHQIPGEAQKPGKAIVLISWPTSPESWES
jgi:hypothetical protein